MWFPWYFLGFSLRETTLGTGYSLPLLVVFKSQKRHRPVPVIALSSATNVFAPRCVYCVKVPKCLGMIGEEWAPDCFRVSFKLETDLERLLPKARVALKR